MNKTKELLDTLETLEEDKDDMSYSLYLKEKEFYIKEIYESYGLEKYYQLINCNKN